MHRQVSAKGYIKKTPRFCQSQNADDDTCFVTLDANGTTAHLVFKGKMARAVANNCTTGKELTVIGNTLPGSVEIYVTRCHFGKDPVLKNVTATSCSIVGLNYHDNPAMADNVNKPTTTRSNWTMSEAYKANKTSKVCVACGQPTAMHVSVSVLYCKCVEGLPK